MRDRDQATQPVGWVSGCGSGLEFRVKSRVGLGFLFRKDLHAGVGLLLLGEQVQGTETVTLAGRQSPRGV